MKPCASESCRITHEAQRGVFEELRKANDTRGCRYLILMTAARYVATWPGAEPRALCGRCTARMQRVAVAMGFALDHQPIPDWDVGLDLSRWQQLEIDP